MPRVTAISAQRRAERVNIHLDGEFWRGAPVALIVDAGLKVGRELSDDEVVQLAEQILVREAMESCLRRLALRGRTRRELAQGLRERKFGDDIAESALSRLDDLGMLDDLPVARQRAETLILRGAGPRKISAELSRLGIDADLREQVMADVVTHEALSAAAGAVVRRRFGDPPYQRDVHMRADRWLRAQGHGADLVAELIGRPLAADDEVVAPDEDQAFSARGRKPPEDPVALLRRKYPRAHTDGGERRRATAFLQRRGMDYDAIRLAIEELGSAAA